MAIADASFAAMLDVPHDDFSVVAWLDSTIAALEGQVALMRGVRASFKGKAKGKGNDNSNWPLEATHSATRIIMTAEYRPPLGMTAQAHVQAQKMMPRTPHRGSVGNELLAAPPVRHVDLGLLGPTPFCHLPPVRRGRTFDDFVEEFRLETAAKKRRLEALKCRIDDDGDDSDDVAEQETLSSCQVATCMKTE